MESPLCCLHDNNNLQSICPLELTNLETHNTYLEYMVGNQHDWLIPSKDQRFHSDISTDFAKLWIEDNTTLEGTTQVWRYLLDNKNLLGKHCNSTIQICSDKCLHHMRLVWNCRKYIYCLMDITVLDLRLMKDKNNLMYNLLVILDLHKDNTSPLYKASIDWSLYWPLSWRRFLLYIVCMKWCLQDNTHLEDTYLLSMYHSQLSIE